MATGFTHEYPGVTPVEWYTPPSVFQALGLTFDLDPCSPGEGRDHVPARARYTIQDNGLAQPWDGLVWCNPPYGREVRAWMRRMTQHRNGIALVFARTGSGWWQEAAPTCDVICLISGRLKFVNGLTGLQANSAGADSALLAWGSVGAEAVLDSGLGFCLTVTSPRTWSARCVG